MRLYVVKMQTYSLPRYRQQRHNDGLHSDGASQHHDLYERQRNRQGDHFKPPLQPAAFNFFTDLSQFVMGVLVQITKSGVYLWT